MRELYIIRHGHPQSGMGLPYDRVPGPGLSDIGRAETHVTAEFLVDRSLDIIYSSPLERTLETARIIVATLGVSMTVDTALAEHRMDENFENVKARIREFLARIDTQPQTSVALVTHGSPIKALLQILSHDMIDLSKYQYPNGNHAPTAGVWHATRDLFGVWALSLIFKPVVATPPAHIAI
jgi:2,3-bisphosphoglycerate-dependent phosphoglycerate mutase